MKTHKDLELCVCVCVCVCVSVSVCECYLSCLPHGSCPWLIPFNEEEKKINRRKVYNHSIYQM
jgi:hypothetical protein